MKKTLILFLLIQIQSIQAGQSPPDSIVSHADSTSVFRTFVYEGSDFYFLRKWGGCFTTDYTVDPHAEVEIVGNDLTVLYRLGLGGSTICASPWPLLYEGIVGIPGLPKGVYNLNYYMVPFEDTFPPNKVDLPNYFIDNISFEVLGSIQVDSLSPLNLLSLISFLFIVGLIVIKRKIGEH